MRAGRLLLLAACFSIGCESSSGPGGEAPHAPLPRELPAELRAELPHTDDGRPVLSVATAHGVALALAHDPSVDDPIARWGQCLSRVAACYRTVPEGPIAGCIARIERCDDGRGGEQCCPAECIDRFLRERELYGPDELDAVRGVFGEGSCVQGLREYLAEVEVAP